MFYFLSFFKALCGVFFIIFVQLCSARKIMVHYLVWFSTLGDLRVFFVVFLDACLVFPFVSKKGNFLS